MLQVSFQRQTYISTTKYSGGAPPPLAQRHLSPFHINGHSCTISQNGFQNPTNFDRNFIRPYIHASQARRKYATALPLESPSLHKPRPAEIDMSFNWRTMACSLSRMPTLLPLSIVPHWLLDPYWEDADIVSISKILLQDASQASSEDGMVRHEEDYLFVGLAR